MRPQRAGSRSIAAGTAKFGSNSIELQCGDEALDQQPLGRGHVGIFDLIPA